MSKWPLGAELDSFIDLSEDNGLLVNNLAVGTVLMLHAFDGALLTLTIIDPKTNKVKLNIKNSQNVDGDYEGFVRGSTFGGCIIKLGWIGAGMRLEFSAPRSEVRIIWSWIKTISIAFSKPSGGQAN